MYPTNHPRHSFSQLDFRMVPTLTRKIPCATVDLNPGDALYIPPFYAVRSYVLLLPNRPGKVSSSLLTNSPHSVSILATTKSIESSVADGLLSSNRLEKTILSAVNQSKKKQQKVRIAAIVQLAHELLRAMGTVDTTEELGRLFREHFVYSFLPSNFTCDENWNNVPGLDNRQIDLLQATAEMLIDSSSVLSRPWTQVAKQTEAYFVRFLTGLSWVEQTIQLVGTENFALNAWCIIGVDFVLRNQAVNVQSVDRNLDQNQY